MSERTPVNPTRLFRFGPLVLAAALAVFAVLRALPPSTVTIETGPVGGSYYQTALKYRDAMKRHGINLKLLPNPDSLAIIGDVGRSGSGIDIGFTAQPVSREQFPNTAAAGVIERQPLFIFYNVALGALAGPSSLRGKRIALPPEESATSEAALDLLGLYGVTRENSLISFMQLAEVAQALKADAADAGVLMLAPSNPFIADLANDSSLRLLGIAEAEGITRHLPSLSTAVLPRGSYSIAQDIPPKDLELLTASVDVVVKKDIDPAALYMLLEAMSEVHHGATLISNAGDFPSIVGTDLLPHPLAVEYMKSGLPWIYEALPLNFASLIDHYFVIGVTILIVTEVYKHLADFSEFNHLILENLCLRVLAHIESTVKRGRPITGRHLIILRIIDRLLFASSRRMRTEELSRRIRTYADPNL
jgi:uncharacterized protein